MTQLESQANQPKEAPASTPGDLNEANKRLTIAQMELKQAEAKLPEGYRYDSSKGLVKIEATAATPAATPAAAPGAAPVQENMATRFYNWVMSSDQGGYVPTTSSDEVKSVAGAFSPLTIMVKGPADQQEK